MDREIPWREIYKSRNHDYFIAAIHKEADSCDDWKPLRPLTPAEVSELKNNPRLRCRVMKSRALYRDKNVGRSPLMAKCRVVVIGCSDADLFTLERNSPVATRLGFYVLLQIYASWMCL